MDEHTRIIIGVRLEKAKDDIATAHDLIALGRLRGAVNRAYYAIYHLATAVLLTQDIERSKHSGVQSAFGQYLVKPGKPVIMRTGLNWMRKQHSESLPTPTDSWLGWRNILLT